MRTMWEALKICLPITLLTFAIFTRSNLVTNPGWAQIGDVLVVTAGTCGVAFAMFGRCFENWAADAAGRLLIAAISLATLFHPDDTLVWATGAVALAAQIWGIRRHQIIASPKTTVAPAEDADAPAPAGDLAPLLAEARREVG
jgi:TRAP-type uncharacterized transport system fused permease subunit